MDKGRERVTPFAGTGQPRLLSVYGGRCRPSDFSSQKEGKERFMKAMVWVCALVVGCALLSTGCSTTPATAEKQAQLTTKSEDAVQLAKKTDPGLQKFFDTAVGYVVFPSVGKGAVGVGGAYGRGELFEGGKRVGYSTLTQASIGLALGGQSYTELIFFETKAALDRFKSGGFAFAAQASAVALKSGVSANAKYSDGVAVFTMGQAGLMYEASVGGQKFSFQPI
jgi:lipid-binding SYLF domain-containing protein